MSTFIGAREDTFRVAPICAVLSIAPRTYHRERAGLPAARGPRDEQLRQRVRRVCGEDCFARDARKVLLRLKREWFAAAMTLIMIVGQDGIGSSVALFFDFGRVVLLASLAVWHVIAGAALIIAAGVLVIVFGKGETEPLLEPLS